MASSDKDKREDLHEVTFSLEGLMPEEALELLMKADPNKVEEIIVKLKAETRIEGKASDG